MIGINNLTVFRIEEKFLKKVARKVLTIENRKLNELSIALVEPKRIKELNKKYRKKNKITDILSFKYNNNSGEIVICPEVVKKNSKKFCLTFKKELTRALIHGILHLLGYDHEKSKRESKKMEKKENYYFSKILNSCPEVT